MKVSLDIVLKIIRQILILAGAAGASIGVTLPAEAQQGVEGLLASIGPFILAVGMIWSWAKDVRKWIKDR